MELVHSYYSYYLSICCGAENNHDWFVIIDLKNAYLHIPVIVERRQFLHFHISIL